MYDIHAPYYKPSRNNNRPVDINRCFCYFNPDVFFMPFMANHQSRVLIQNMNMVIYLYSNGAVHLDHE